MVFGCAKYSQMGYPWKDIAKYSSDALILCQWDSPVEGYEQISFLADIPWNNNTLEMGGRMLFMGL